LDVVVQDRQFASDMEAMYATDLTNATEVILDSRRKLTSPPGARGGATPRTGGSASRAAAGLLRISNTVGAAISGHRVLEPIEARIMIVTAMGFMIVGTLGALFPRLLAYPLAAGAIWLAGAPLYRGHKLRRAARHESSVPGGKAGAASRDA
jgi:cardiolipin synthase A/B